MNDITYDAVFAFCCEVVAIDWEVVRCCDSKVAVLAVHCVFNTNRILDNCGEVVEDAVSIDTGSVVVAVTAVAGTEGSVCANEVVTGLHTLNSLVLVTCYVPSLNAVDGLAVFCLCCAIACAEAAVPILPLLAEVAVRNELADVVARNVTADDCILQPLRHTLCLSLDFLASRGVNVDDVLVSTERIVFTGLLYICQICLKSVAKIAFEACILFEECLHSFALVDVSLIDGSVLHSGSLRCFDSCDCFGISLERLNVVECLNCCAPCIKQRLSSDDTVDCFLFVMLYSSDYIGKLRVRN